MKVKFIYNIGNIHKIGYKEVQSKASDEDIKALFPLVIGISYHEKFCDYEIVKEGD
jgi:hypothetical protein